MKNLLSWQAAVSRPGGDTVFLALYLLTHNLA
jgi:hypothetical protein